VLASALVPVQAAPEDPIPEQPDSRKAGTLAVPDMDGAQVVPGPGDPDGSGSATIPIDSRINRICWNVQTSNLQLPLSGALIRVAVPVRRAPSNTDCFPTPS
jgi:hypothetical protein